MRDGWSPDSFFLAVDHGPLTSQHCHLDTLGFVAYAHGHPVALDSGIGTTYEDPRYKDWFRVLRAHNVIVIDDIETEKVAERLFWKPGTRADVLGVRSRAYEHALGILHDRTFFFVKGVGWLIHDRLHAPATFDFVQHRIDWVLHTPYALVPEAPGILHAANEDGGLLVISAFPEALQAPQLELMPASVPIAEAREMRLWDIGRISPHITKEDRTRGITTLAWPWQAAGQSTCEFATLLLPYHGARPDTRLHATADGFILQRAGEPDIIFRTVGELFVSDESK